MQMGYNYSDAYYKKGSGSHDTKKLESPQPFALPGEGGSPDESRWLSYRNYDSLAEQLENDLRRLVPALNVYVLRLNDLSSLAYFEPVTQMPSTPVVARSFVCGRKRVLFPYRRSPYAAASAVQQHKFVIFAPQDINDNILYLVTDISCEMYQGSNDSMTHFLADRLLQALRAKCQELP